MNNLEINQENSSVNTTQNKQLISRTILKTVLICAVLTVGIVVGYYISETGSDDESPVNQSVNKSENTTVASDGLEKIQFIKASGLPFDDKAAKYRFESSLGVPDFMHAVKLWSSNGNKGEGYGLFTDGTLNNELGRWLIGDPTNPDDNSSGYSEVSLLAITNSWLNVAGNDNQGMSDFGPLQTPAQKKKFITETKTKTLVCSNDAKKGFSTPDKSLNICITYNYGREGYSPSVTVLGYGELAQQPLLLTGLINIYDKTDETDRNKVFEVIKNANEGNPPQSTALKQNKIISALKQTTVKAVPVTQ
ncbi:MAG: hypothetical protein QFB86_04065 [Patescibacteria group bacterium]|nr:hypothetical protein [Patescibacteria group bacterium]